MHNPSLAVWILLDNHIDLHLTKPVDVGQLLHLLGRFRSVISPTAERSSRSRDTEGKVRSVAFSTNGKRIVSGSEDDTVKVWDAANGQEVITIRGHKLRVTSGDQRRRQSRR